MSRWLSKSFRKDPLSPPSGSTPKLNILVVLACVFIALVIILAWFSLNRVQEKIKADVGEALEIVLQTTQESLNLWVESGKFQLSRLADEPRLVSLAERQIEVARSRKDLSESGALFELREFFLQNKDRFGQAGFFIISPDFVNIASMSDKNLGSRNRIASQALDLINRAFQGETVLVPPMWSDVESISSSGNKVDTLPAMFFVAPIKDDQGQIIATVARQIDPAQDFTRLIQLGRIGKTGETYAFSKYAKLLSESRFDEDLRKIGLIDEGQRGILSISIRDPGGNMVAGFSPSVPGYQQPLTFMAEQATKGKSGLNVQGYRNYKGIRVYGTWLWDQKLDFGLTTEIEESEALSPYYTARAVIIIVLGVTVLLALGSLLFAVLIDVRANRALQKSYDELELRVEERTAELKENQARLAQAEERSRLLLESVEEGIFGVGKDGLVNFINPAGLAMLGFEADELIGQKIHALIHHTLPDGSPYPIEECPMHHSLTRGTIGNRDDEVLWRKDGTAFPVEYTSVPIRKNGSIAGTVVVFRDVSERKQAEEALRKSRATARGLLDATQESLLLLDSEGIIVAVNQTAARRNQRTPQELVGTNRFDILPQNLRESRKAHFNNVLQTGNPADFEDVRDGMVLHHIYYPVSDKSGAIIGVAIFAQDITEPKHMEEALRRNVEELERFSKLVFGREKKMIQLKQEINELLGQLGQGEKYKIVE